MTQSFDKQFDGWDNYVARTAGRPPRPLLVKAMDHVVERGSALDLGSGALNDSLYMLEQGFASVTALDLEAGPTGVISRLPSERFTHVQTSFEAFDYRPATYDLISAQFALPFIKPDMFPRVMASILLALRPGGVLTGQLFGDRDDWAGEPTMTFHTERMARELLAPLQVHIFEEEDDPLSSTAAGEAKHWHLFHVIASKLSG